MDSAGNIDPTGVLSATTAAVRLVGTVLNVAPAVQRAIGQNKGIAGSEFSGGAPGENDVTGVSTTAPLPTADQIQSLALQRVDPERETRAYETVNFVLRTIGSRIIEARMVNMDALAKALTAATSHIEVKLFSGDTNRLFQSLARKLNDVNLVNSVFTSIYLVGFLTAELTGSLPNYKREYPAIGPVLVQQMMRGAIGEDAFRENQTANLNAYHVVATTAGLLRPTDIGYSIFPDFPSFAPTRYSSKSIIDRQSHKNVLDKLIKHFDLHGFPQPLQGRDVGPIRDWRFLAGDSNSRSYEVEKADKHIGMNFGRVLYWLICSAHRMPSGMAVVGYLDQHIALIRFLGPRFGYRVLNAGGDLNLSGPHLQMNRKQRATFDTWVVVMPSETILNERRIISQAATQGPFPPTTNPQGMPQPQAVPQHQGIPPPQGVPQSQASSSTLPPHNVSGGSQHPNVVPVVIPGQMPPMHPPGSPAAGAGRQSISSEASSQAKPGASSSQAQVQASGSPLQQLNELEKLYMTTLLPSSNDFIASPPSEVDALKKEYFRLTESLQSMVLFKIDAVEPGTDDELRLKRKGLVDNVQTTLAKLDEIYREASKVSSPPSRPLSMASLPSLKPATTADQSFSMADSVPAELAAGSSFSEGATQIPATHEGAFLPPPIDTTSTAASGSTQVTSPVSVSPPATEPSSTAATTPSIAPALQSRPSVVRRKAPPPPKKVILAKALYDFEAEEEGGEELNFAEGDILEIVEKNKALEEDGWCRARVKGQKRIGLAPLDYLEELPNQPSAPSRPGRISSISASEPILEQPEQPAAASNASKIDAKIDLNVSSTSQNSHPTSPNTSSPAIQSLNSPSHSSVQHPVSSMDISPPLTPPEQLPPSYAAATSPPIANTNQPPSTGTITLSPPNAMPQPQPGTATASPPLKPTTSTTGPQTSTGSPVQPLGSSKPPNTSPLSSGSPINSSGSYKPPQNQHGGYRPPMGRPPATQAVQYGPGGPQMPYYTPMAGPGMYQQAAPASNLHAYVGMAEAASGFAQAGAHVFSAVHGNSNNGHQGGNTTNVYNNNNDSHNQTTDTSTTNNTNQSTSNATETTNNISSNQQATSTTNDNSNNSNYDYSMPYFPPDTTSTPGYNTSSTSAPQNSTDSGPTFDLSPSFNPTFTSPPQTTLAPSSGPSSDPSTYATAPAPDPSQYSFDPGFTSAGPVSPFASLSSSPVPAQTTSPFDTSVIGGASPPAATGLSATDPTQAYDSGGATSPFANLASPDSNTAVSPFAALASPDSTNSYFGSTTTPQAVSPFASLATPDTTTITTQPDGTTTDTPTVTSPFASLAITDSTTTTTDPSTGYFSTTTTTDVSFGSASPDAVSPFAGLAASPSATVDSTTVTSADAGGSGFGFGSGSGGGVGMSYGDSSGANLTSTTTTMGYDTSASTGGGWNFTDYSTTTTTDSSGYGFTDSYEF